ncbi:sugar kinase [bacterium]|nr:MAG: sugar kinase [bacterium]
MSIVVVGSVAFDSISSPHGSVERAVGGSATYFSLAASIFSSVKLVAVVGEDFGAENIELFHRKGIDTEGLEVVEGGKTFFWQGSYMEDMNERDTIKTELNVFEGFDPTLPDSYRSSEFLFLGNIDPDLQIRVLEQVKGDPIIGCDTMNFWIDRKRQRLHDILKKIDILFINDSEAVQLSGEKNLIRAGRRLIDTGPQKVVIKKGEHGSVLFSGDEIFLIPAFPLEEVVDPTGAGDSYAGAFFGYLDSAGGIDNNFFKRAVVYATVVAGFTCEGFSVERLARLEREEVEERYKRFIEMFTIT